MQRVTITIDADLLGKLDEFMVQKHYANRSEAIRDMVRDRLEAERLNQESEEGACIATVSYVYDHEERELAKRLAHTHHQHHHLSHATLHTHLDENTCLEAAVLKGSIADVKSLANAIIAERGVRHGAVNLVPVDLPSAHPHHAAHHHQEAHSHSGEHSHEHTHEHKHVHDHEHTHAHEHWHTHKDGTYHSHPHEHTHSHAHEHVHNHGHEHTHEHENSHHTHKHTHDHGHTHDFRAHDHDHLNEDHGPHTHDHPGHEAESHDDHSH